MAAGRPMRLLGVGPGAVLTAIGAQGLSSLTNFGVQLGLALSLAPARFGAIVVGFAVYYFALALVRALIGDPLVALATAGRTIDGNVEWRGDVLWDQLRPRLLVISACSAVAVSGLSLVLVDVRAELSWLAAALPALLLQDGLRSWCWARSRPDLVAALDGVWVVASCLVAGTGMLIVGPGNLSGAAVLAAWASGGAVSAVFGWRLRSRLVGVESKGASLPAVAQDPAELRADESATARSLGSSQTALAIDANGLPAVVALVAGTVVSGGMRAAALPFMPVTTIVAALRQLTLPLLKRAMSAGTIGRSTALVAAATAAIATALAGLILAMLSIVPPSWLGPSGREVQPWFFAAAVVISARMVATPLSDVLALGVDQRQVLRLRVGTTLLDWLATLTGALVGGLSAAMAARAAAAVLALGVWGLAVAEALRRRPPGPAGNASEESQPLVEA